MLKKWGICPPKNERIKKMIKYITYESVNGLPFGATVEKAIQIFGKPEEEDVDRADNILLYYENYVINFNDKKEFVYFGIDHRIKEEIIINTQKAGWTLKEVANIIQMDSNPVVSGAYIILRDLGVTFINFHDIEDDDMSERAIAFFAKGEMEVYDNEQSFRLKDQLDNPNNSLQIIVKPKANMRKEEQISLQNKNNIPEDFMK